MNTIGLLQRLFQFYHYAVLKIQELGHKFHVHGFTNDQPRDESNKEQKEQHLLAMPLKPDDSRMKAS